MLTAELSHRVKNLFAVVQVLAERSAPTSSRRARSRGYELIASDKVEGTAVYNRAGERLGEVYNFMVDKYSGRVACAVRPFGGFLGIGEKYHPLPWRC